jgi:4-hydroxybenzoate polyprenyltransferase
MQEPAEPSRSRGFLLDLLDSMRPQQWVKNLLVLAPLLFAKGLGDTTKILEALLAFLIFCALSSGVYLLNDVLDLDKDRKHPIKSKRPIASGRLKVSTAVIVLVVIFLGALTAGFALNSRFGLAGLAYVLLNLGYSFWLKEMVILDVMIIAFGFVLRALAGALAIQVVISPWLILCTIMLSLFLAFCKRRRELELLADGARDHRPALKEYSVVFLDQMISITTASTVVCYSFYTISPEVEQKLGTHHLFVTIPFVLYGIFRYLYLVHQRGEGGNPASSLLTDRPLLTCVALWALVVAGILYFDTFQ